MKNESLKTKAVAALENAGGTSAIQSPNDNESEEHAGHPPILLVVDDDADILRVVRFYLTKQDYRVHTASSGKEALAVLTQEEDIELVLSDVMMPEMNGLDLLKHIRSDPVHRDTPVILISAEGETSKKVTGLNLGADDFITKPFNFDELMARVKNHIRLRRLQKEVLLANKMVMETNRLLQKNNDKLVEDLEAARGVQMALMPDQFPDHPAFKIGSRYLPAERLGGDLFDVVLLEGGKKLGILVADVCGHGVTAAFITAMTKISFQNACRISLVPGEVMTLLNKELASNINNGYVTAFYAVLDLETKVLSYSSGGHPPLLVYRPGSAAPIELSPQATFLGFFDSVEYTTNSLPLKKGDRVFFYTDGIYESQNKKEEQYGMDRFRAFIQNKTGEDIQQVLNLIFEDVVNFMGNQQFDDDLTLVGLHIRA